MALSEALVAALRADRSEFNAQVLSAKHRFQQFDEQALRAFIADGVDPIVCAVANYNSACSAQVSADAFSIALELIGRKLCGTGGRYPIVERAWRDLIPRFAPLLTLQSYDVIASITNAVVNLQGRPGTRVDDWLQNLGALAPRIQNLSQLQHVGNLLAWRAGLAHYRIGALKQADNLPDELALAALGASEKEDWQQVRRDILQNPWRVPANDGVVRQRVGAFRGFGGAFTLPPAVRSDGKRFFVRSENPWEPDYPCEFFLHADAYGIQLIASEPGHFDTLADTGFYDGKDIGTWLTLVPELRREAFSVVENEHTVICFGLSMSIFALPRETP